MDEKPIHKAPCQGCGKMIPCFVDPREYHIDGLYCSKDCRALFKKKLGDFIEKVFGKSD